MACCVPNSASILGPYSHDTTKFNNRLIMSSQTPKLPTSKITTSSHNGITVDEEMMEENAVSHNKTENSLFNQNHDRDREISNAQEISTSYNVPKAPTPFIQSNTCNYEKFMLDCKKGKQTNESSSQEHDAELTTEQIENVLDEVQLPSNLMFVPSLHSPKCSDIVDMIPHSVKRSHSFEGHEADVDTPNSSMKRSKAEDSLPTSPYFPSIPIYQPRLTTTFSSSSLDSECHSNGTDPHKTSSFGRWTRAEHQAFLQGLKQFGREWKKVALNIPTRSSAQIRSHAQKYFAKLAKDDEQQKEQERNVIAFGTSQKSSSPVVSMDVYSDSSFDSSALTPSVLQRVEKILQDPHGAQIEVENTLRLLKERYAMLQTKLYQDQLTTDREKQQISASAFDLYSSINKSSSTNEFPHSTPIKISAERIALHKKELIALHVLGGELYRSGSRENLESEHYPRNDTSGTKYHSDADSRDSSLEE